MKDFCLMNLRSLQINFFSNSGFFPFVFPITPDVKQNTALNLCAALFLHRFNTLTFIIISLSWFQKML